MKHVFIMDPIESVRVDLDSTFALMCEAQKREHQVFYALGSGLSLEEGVPLVNAAEARLQPVQGRHAELGPWERLNLAEADVVWMRKDPPFNMDYIFSTYVLDHAVPTAQVVNAPEGLRNMNEKTWAMRFPTLIPETLITQNQDEIRRFAKAFGTIVVKPLDGNGGEGVFIVDEADPNIGVIVEMSTVHGTRKVMAQRYLPEAKQGDKRIILVNGEPVGAINRIPTGVDHRGNMHAGARVEAAAIDERDREICGLIGPPLREAGQVFVGIDVIGGFLTEVNVTSPTGIHEINRLHGLCVEQLIVDAVDQA
jgi:glutathione synthase